jgi:hypothetical protein
MKTSLILPMLLLLCSLCIPHGVVFAQEGFHGGFRFSHSQVRFDNTSFDENSEKGKGPGIGLSVGYGFNPVYTMMISLSSHKLNDGDANAHYAEIVGRFHPIPDRREYDVRVSKPKILNPFVEAGVLGTYFKYTDIDSRFSGPGVSVGTGLKLSLGKAISFEAGIRPARVLFEKVRVGKVVSDVETIKSWQMRSYAGLSIYLQ